MLALRRLCLIQTGTSATAATLSSLASAPSVEAASDAQPKTRGRKKYPTRRPYISLERPREWRRPLAPGVLPVYDEALRLIFDDSRRIQREAQAVQAQLESGELQGEKAERERKRLDVLHIMSKVNIPSERWKVANGMGEPYRCDT